MSENGSKTQSKPQSKPLQEETEISELRVTIMAYLENKLKNKKLATGFEEALYNNTINCTSLQERKMFKYQIFKQRYNYGLGFIVLNLPHFEKKIKMKEIKFEDIFSKSPTELFPDKWEESDKRKREEEKFLYETQLVSNCNTMCFKCKETNVYVFTKQTRGADEPETVFYSCISCSTKWKR